MKAFTENFITHPLLNLFLRGQCLYRGHQRCLVQLLTHASHTQGHWPPSCGGCVRELKESFSGWKMHIYFYWWVSHHILKIILSVPIFFFLLFGRNKVSGWPIYFCRRVVAHPVNMLLLGRTWNSCVGSRTHAAVANDVEVSGRTVSFPLHLPLTAGLIVGHQGLTRPHGNTLS